jgi:hypothetical protein
VGHRKQCAAIRCPDAAQVVLGADLGVVPVINTISLAALRIINKMVRGAIIPASSFGPTMLCDGKMITAEEYYSQPWRDDRTATIVISPESKRYTDWNREQDAISIALNRMIYRIERRMKGHT